MEVRVSKTRTRFETEDQYTIGSTGEYDPTISIDSKNRISIGLIPPKGSDKPAVHFSFGRQISNELISMINRLGFHSYGGGVR